LAERFDIVSRNNIKTNMKTNARKALQKHLSGKFDAKTNIFTVSFVDINPEFARDVVNATVEILDRRFAVLGGNRAVTQKNLLEAKLIDIKASIDDLEAKTRRFQAKYGVINVEALATEQVTLLARLRSELIMKDLEITNYETMSNVQGPAKLQLLGEKESIFAKIRELESGKGQTEAQRIMPSQTELPAIAFEYAKLQRDLQVQVEVYKVLTQQYELAKLNAAGQEPVFQILELAEAPDMKSGPARANIVIVAILAGFFGFVLLAFILEAIMNIRKDPEAMAKLTGALGAHKRRD
jgi:tyrosine-protein kinase Etk/Wzc